MDKINFKRLLTSLFLSICMIFTLVSTVSAIQETPIVKLDGNVISFPVDGQPYINENQRTMVSVRFVTESMNCKVDWDDAKQLVTITKGDKKILLTIGEKWAIVNDIKKEFDTQAILKGDRTFVPLRFLSETLGATVVWDETNNTVIINSDEVSDTTEKEQIKYFRIESSEINIPEIIEMSKLPYVTQISGDAIEKYRTSKITVSFQDKDKDNYNQLRGILSVNYMKDPFWVTLDLGKYSDTTLELLKNVLAISYPNDTEFQSTLYTTIVNYRGIQGFKHLSINGYEIYLKQSQPITDTGVWGRDAFNVWCQIVKK